MHASTECLAHGYQPLGSDVGAVQALPAAHAMHSLVASSRLVTGRREHDLLLFSRLVYMRHQPVQE